MSGRKPAPPASGAGGGAASPPPPPPARKQVPGQRQQHGLNTVTFDGSLFDAPAAGRPMGGSPKPAAGQGSPGGSRSGGKPKARPRPPPAVLLDNGECARWAVAHTCMMS